MRRDLYLYSLLAGALVLSAGMARAQEGANVPPPPPPMMHGGLPGPGGPLEAFGEGMEVLGFGGLHGGKVVTGAPFSAVATSEFTQTLTDGTQVTGHITRTTQMKIYRDSQGRVRRDVTISTPSGQTRTFTVINDPTTSPATQYLLQPDKMIAYVHKMRGAPENAGPGGPGKGAHGPWKGNAGANVATKSLGTQMMPATSGVNAEGTQFTRTIQIGNNQVTVTSERWVSSGLQIVMMAKHSDPRFGTSSYTITSLQQQDQPASLFTVPAGYTVQQGGPRRGMRRFRGGPPPADAPAPPAGAPGAQLED